MKAHNRCSAAVFALFLVSVPIIAERADSLPADLSKAQSHMAEFMRAATNFNLQLRQLFGIACIDFSHSALHACKQMASLKVAQHDIDAIKSKVGVLEGLARPAVKAVRDAVDAFNVTLTAINRQLNSAKSADLAAINELLQRLNWNLTAAEHSYNEALSTMASGGQQVENNVRRATRNLAGPEIALIYELIGRCKAKFGTKEAEVKQSWGIFTQHAENTKSALAKIVHQLDSNYHHFYLDHFDLPHIF